MPELRNPQRDENAVPGDLRALLEEHQLLRADIERLLQQNQQLLQEREQRNAERNGSKPSQDEAGAQERKKPEEKKDEKGKGDGDKDGDKEDEEKPKPPLRQRVMTWVHKHPRGAVLLVLGAIVVIVVGLLYWRYLQSYVDTDDAEVDGNISQVSSRISGTVIGVYVENNRSVVRNQTLVDLDPRDYETALAQAQANLTQAIGALHAQAPQRSDHADDRDHECGHHRARSRQRAGGSGRGAAILSIRARRIEAGAGERSQCQSRGGALWAHGG